MKQEASAAREKAIRENVPGLGVPHWSEEAMEIFNAYRLSHLIMGKTSFVLQPSLAVENNRTLEESTYAQFKQRVVEVRIGDQAYSLV